MVIRLARLQDLPAIMHVIACARSRMRAEGNAHQWEGYPTEETILEDINSGTFYVFVDDAAADDAAADDVAADDVAADAAAADDAAAVHGCFSLAPGPDPDYLDIDGSWLDDSPYGVIHRVATDNTFSHAMSQVLEFAQAQGFHHIRIDTNGDNVTMRAVLERLGFHFCGQLRRGRQGPWYAYELLAEA